MPWSEVAVDLIGPWTININGEDIQFRAITFIDTVTNLPEFARINNKSSEHIGQKLEDVWCSQYPCPLKIIHDNGGEFTGEGFQ